MKTFKTLDDLHEYNNQAFEKVFGSVKAQQPENPYEEGSWDDLKFKARPHEVFKLDWSSYSSKKYADIFLPYIKNAYGGTSLEFYDGAELFKGLKKADKKQFKFDDGKDLQLMNFTYPKGVLAENRKHTISVSDNEVLTFIEVDESDNIDIHFKFGKRFKTHLADTIKTSKQSLAVNQLEEKVYQSDVKSFKDFFKQELTHYQKMRFILNTLGIEEDATKLANYNKAFSPKVLNFMDNYSLGGKYNVEVFVKASQTEVYEAVDNDKNPNRTLPPPDTIYIWLVSEDFINYDTSFIRIQVGTTIAKDLEQKNITIDYLEAFVLNKIKEELEQNIYSKETVDKATGKGLADTFFLLGQRDDLASDKVLRDVFETNPGLYMAIKAADFLVKDIESLKFKEKHWNPRVKDFEPAFDISTQDNAILCGIINGLIDSVKAIPELVKLISTMLGSDEEWEKFKKGIIALLTDEKTKKALIASITKDYKDSFNTGNIEKLFYTMAHDSIAVVSILIGIYGLVKGIASIIGFIGKALKYIRRYGIKAIKNLKKLRKKSIIEIFDRLESGSGGFYKYKRLISRDMVKQEEWMSCAAACIKRYADDLGIDISESQIRAIAKTSESGTDGKDIYLAMKKIFKDKDVSARTYFNDIDDLKNFNTMLSETGGEKFITNIGRYPNKHTIIVDKIDGNQVFIRDPWPLEVDEAFEKGIRGIELENIFEQSEKGVQAVLDLNEFQSLWAQGGNIMFKIN